MNCKYCGKEIVSGQKFCGNCGKEVGEAKQEPMNTDSVWESKQEGDLHSTNRKSLLIPSIIGLCAVLLLAVFGVSHLKNDRGALQAEVEKLASDQNSSSEAIADSEENEKKAEETDRDQSDSSKASTYAYVQDRYLKVIYDDSLEREKAYCYHIPEVVMPGGIKIEAEDEIYDDMMQILEEKVFPYEDTGKPLLDQMIYTWGKTGDILSIVVQMEKGVWDDDPNTDLLYHVYQEYSVYQIDLRTGKMTSNEELLRQFGLTQDEFYATAKANIEKTFDEQFARYLSSEEEDIQAIKKELLSDERIENVIPYSSGGDNLEMIVNMYEGNEAGWNYYMMPYNNEDSDIKYWTIGCSYCHKVELYTESKEGAESVRNLLASTMPWNIQTYCYDDYDNDGYYEAFIVTKEDEEGNIGLHFISSKGDKCYLWTGQGEVPNPNIMQAGNHKFFCFSYIPKDSSEGSKMLLFGVKDGYYYQPSISGQFSQFGRTDWTEYYNIPSNAPKESFYGCNYDPEASNGKGAYGDYTYFTYDEEERQFVPKKKGLF